MYIEIYSIVGKRCRKNKQGRNRLKLLANGRLEMKKCKHVHTYGINEKKIILACDFCGSNTGPSDLQSDALPTELKPLVYR